MNKKTTSISVIILFMCVFLWAENGTAYIIDDATKVKAYKNGSAYNGIGSTSGKDYSAWIDVVGDETLYNTYGIDISIDENSLNFDIYTNFPESGDPATKNFWTGNNWLIPADLFFSIDIYEYGVGLTGNNKGKLYYYPTYETSYDIFMNKRRWIYGGMYDEPYPKEVPVLISGGYLLDDSGLVAWNNIGSGPNFRIDVDIPLTDSSGGILFNPDLDIFQIDVLFGTAICGNDVIAGSPEPVPEPATMILFGTGLLGLAGIGRKKLRSSKLKAKS